MNKVKEVNVYESYGLEDSKFKIKVNKEFELWEKGVRVLGLCGNSRRCILLNWYKEGLVLDGEGSFILWEGIDRIVKKGEEVGLWEVDKCNGRKLNIIDKNGRNWSKFWEVIVW